MVSRIRPSFPKAPPATQADSAKVGVAHDPLERRPRTRKEGPVLLPVTPPPAPSALSVLEKAGILELQNQGRAALQNVTVKVTTGQGAFDTRVGAPETSRGQDAAGPFECTRYPLIAEKQASLPFQARLELRRYHSPEVLVATLDYD